MTGHAKESGLLDLGGNAFSAQTETYDTRAARHQSKIGAPKLDRVGKI